MVAILITYIRNLSAYVHTSIYGGIPTLFLDNANMKNKNNF